jgi:hypothetical protein
VNVQSWQKEREEFDQCYSDSLARTVEVLGPARIEGVDTDEDRHRYAIWRGREKGTGTFSMDTSAKLSITSHNFGNRVTEGDRYLFGRLLSRMTSGLAGPKRYQSPGGGMGAAW